MRTAMLSADQLKVTGSCTECYLAWNDLRHKGWKVSKPMYWKGRGRGFHAAIEFIKAQ